MGQALRGRFVTFEGGEGVGKTTQVALLAQHLKSAGHDVLTTREPGGSPAAEELRRLIIETGPWDAESEALLMVAARRSHLAATVWPALTAGRIVISDRFADSTEAYQGFARGLDRARLAELHRFIAGDFRPDLTLILDLPAAEGLSRAKARGAETRFERLSLEFHEKLRQGYLEIAAREPVRCAVIDARPDATNVAAAVRAAVHERLALR